MCILCPGDILIEGPHFKRKYFKLPKGENSTSTWMALERPYALIISREKNFIRDFWVMAKLVLTAGLFICIGHWDIGL